ncbi:MAG: hypothetical protein IPK65_02770 [Gammaproteobacteria bacterium]|nr:hypothetical protein [Gammaproteobacteria bacterium]
MAHHRYLLLAACLTFFGCTGGDQPDDQAGDRTGDHVWKGQENAYKKAQEIAPMLEETDIRRRDLMEEQGG